MRGGFHAIGAVVCVVVVSTTAAQALRDPTRPPAFASAKGAITGKNEITGWVLQSVLISPERRYAIINGEVVPLGGSIAGAELVAIAEERVTLRTREGLRTLHLFPDVTRLDGDAARRVTTGRAPAEPNVQKNVQDPQSEGSAGTKRR
jgi:hypothetical protein